MSGGSQKRRRSERMPLDEAARLRPNEWSSLEVRLLDLSSCGFRARCQAFVLRGSCVRIDLPGIGEVEAMVSWRRNNEIGASFIQPIDLDQCQVSAIDSGEALLARLLVQRASARASGLYQAEQHLRDEILKALPIVKV